MKRKTPKPNVAQLVAALELCWQATGEAIAGDVSREKLLAANRAARQALSAHRAKEEKP